MSLADQILKLSSTAPDLADSDDDFTSAQLVDRKDLEEDLVSDDENLSTLRLKSAALLDEDERYKGRRTSRKYLKNDDQMDDDDDEANDSEKDAVSSDEDDVDDEGANDIDADESDDDFNEAVVHKMKVTKVDAAKVLSEGRSDESDSENDSEEEEEEGEEEEEEETEDEGIDIKPTDSNNKEVEKGKAARAQIGLWDSMLEVRMKLRKVQSLVNRLPIDLDEEDVVYEARKEAEKALLALCNQLMFLQTCLLLQYPDTRKVVGGQAAEQQARKPKDEDEITSESEVEDDERLNLTGIKRKLESAAYPDFLSKRHTEFQSFRNAAIHKWNEKTNLASGKVKKSFGAFEQSTLKQIDQILSDKDRLLKRTQLNRSNVKVIGAITDGGEIKVETPREPEHHTEMFDDDDFYHQLLREIIERKSAQSDDPVALSRHWLEMQKFKTKVKKVVDTKASKGRKIRYNVQAKLINFMAPNDTTTWNDDQRDELFKSLYGHRFAAMAER